MSIKEDSRDKYSFYTPSDTANILYSRIKKKGRWEYNPRKQKNEKKEWWYESKNDVDNNINLLFSKLIPETSLSEEKGQNKSKFLEFIVKEFEKFKKSSHVVEILKLRNDNLFNSMRNSGFYASNFVAECHWRFVIGLGASHPQETSMTLHHIYGIPYIPGSAVKGVTKHYAVLTLADKYRENFKSKEGEEDFIDAIKNISRFLENGENINLSIDDINFANLIEIFGTQRKAGQVIFMDAYPIENINLKIDIMNTHYPDYYSKNKPPADWQTPNPIKFLTVERTKFQFNLLSRDKNMLGKAEMLLKNALKEFGIGAKTSLGYGLFNEYNQ